MIIKITINEDFRECTAFLFGYDDTSLHVCKVCREHLISDRYLVLMCKLKEAGLLKKDFKEMCCYCYDKNN